VIVELEKRRANEPCFLKDRKHPGKLKYYRYADDCAPRRRGKEAEMAT
jgi:hypothetical protein